MNTALLSKILVAPAAGARMISMPEALIVEGRGIEGDRYFDDRGTWKRNVPRGGDAITLIEEEKIVAAAEALGEPIMAEEMRRNLVVRGVNLDDFIGAQFRIGEVLLEGLRRCEPCGYIERLAEKPFKTIFAGIGGLRATILRGGLIRVGDSIELSEMSSAVHQEANQ
jgi:MOSC domain-containing protein YiiM